MRDRRRSASALLLVLALAAPLAVIAEEPDQSREQRQQTATERPDAAEEAADPRTDRELALAIERRLARSRSLAGTEIEVAVERRTALLTGTIGEAAEEDRALRIAQATPGIRAVVAQLDIDRETVEGRRTVRADDAQLARSVASQIAEAVFPWARVRDDWAFGWEVDGYSWDFDVEADAGDITLTGTVPTRQHIVRAVRVARRVPGVQRVDSDLRVDPFTFGQYDPRPATRTPLEWQEPP